ncbi:F-box protein [Phanerochaete sordida]|uniref:F-box protein n=1 Tax=Phanerochaete sordida TaxID=48140 RepID=A0A9P3GS20_9APHY|nr:F-box protein [Phanerochaete sordida]
MHSCLLIHEILQDIFGYFNEYRDLHSLSLVCRAFLAPANDELWADLPGLSPLIKCLPDHLLGDSEIDEGILTIVQPPRTEDWHRVQLHAFRVKSLRVELDDGDHKEYTINQAALEIFVAGLPSNAPLLPRLESLAWHNWSLAKFAPLFINPSLTFLEYYPSSETPEVLARVAEAAPRLRILRLFDTQYSLPEPVDAVFNDTLLCLNHLTQLNFDHVPLRADTLVHLSRLPSLLYLSVFLLKHDVTSWTSPSWGGFPRLERLSLIPDRERGRTIPSAPFLRALSGASLTSLDITMPPAIGESELEQLMSAIGHLHRLLFLSINFNDWHVEGWGSLVFDATVLSPLYAIGGMTSLTVINAPITLQPQSVHELAHAWQDIRGFSLHSSDHCHLRLEDLAVFSQHWHKLDTLKVQLYPVESGWEHDDKAGRSASSLSYLHLCTSRIARPATAQVAQYLAEIFPYATIEHGFHRQSWELQRMTAEEIEAGAVLDNVKALKKELRRQLRRRASGRGAQRPTAETSSSARTANAHAT